MFNLYSTMNRRNEDKEEKEIQTTGHDRFCQERPSRSTYRKKRKKHVRRAQSAAEFASHTVLAAHKRHLFRGRSVSSEQDNSESEHSEKSPLVSAKLDSLAKLLFSKSLLQDNGNTNKDIDSPTRNSVRYQYTALDSGIGASDRNPRERAARDRALTACQEWMQNSGGRYEIIAHLDDIGSRTNKHWFLLNDTTVRTDRLMTLLPIPPDCVALEELPPSECPKGILMELLGSLQHPYIYPVLDLGFLHSDSHHYACLVMPFNPRGSLKDLIYKVGESQWNEPWSRKYTRKSTCLPLSQVQRLGRQILEALLFLRERGFSSHGHLHSGNVILQNGVARLSGLENGLLGLNSRVNAVMWSRTANEIDSIDVICFGHLLFEMCAGYELSSPQPTPGHLELDLERYPQVADVLQMIFDSPDGRYPTVEELVLHDLFRNIDLREMRGTCVPSFKHGLSNSTMSLLNAVRRRQGAIMEGSQSESSSPCTPPSTPRERRTGDLNSPDLSSDSDCALDEIVITPSSFELHQYDPLNSPIHFCDASFQSDDSTVTPHSTLEESECLSATNQQKQMLSANDLCCYKNSKSRRMEYSMRGLKLGVSNPSQDSAFGSMTDGDISIASSSFRLSSFQSITSPIDEGVEDLTTAIATTTSIPVSSSFGHTGMNELIPSNCLRHIDSTSSSPCHEMLSASPTPSTSGVLSSPNSLQRSESVSPKRQHQRQNHQNSDFNNSILEPPILLVNDQRSIYTTSPSKKCGTIEVFSQKYRVSSFEDMSRQKLRNKNKIAFRSFEEERRIDSAFLPFTNRVNSENRVNSSEKYKKLTHAAFSNKIYGTREKHIMWKNSILSRKNNLIKSNESLLESTSSSSSSYQNNEEKKLISRGSSINEISTCTHQEVEPFLGLTESLQANPRKSRSERTLFNLANFKQNTITDAVNFDYFSEDDTATITFITNDNTLKLSNREKSFKFRNCERHPTKIYGRTKDLDDNGSSSSIDALLLISSPTHGDACKSIGSCEPDPDSIGSNSSNEEKTPLLEGMEMSPLTTPTEPDDIL